jgi:predicted nuclease of predicted toxin-antitoxin system
MRIKLDENLPSQLVPVLTELGHDVDTVPSEGITGKDDAIVWHAAQACQRFLITQDLDFSDVRKYTPGTHHGLLLVRLPEPGRTALLERISTLFQVEDVKTWGGCIIIATPHKVRVRRPPSEPIGEGHR